MTRRNHFGEGLGGWFAGLPIVLGLGLLVLAVLGALAAVGVI